MSQAGVDEDRQSSLASDEEYVEEEVTDNETDDVKEIKSDSEPAKPQSVRSTSLANAVSAETPMQVDKKRGPAISDRVKKVIKDSPGATASRSGPSKPVSDKISLAHTGNWDAQTFSEVNIVFPTIGQPNETTNDLTRRTRPENRYWKGDLKFSHGTENSQTIRVFNVPIPYAEGAKYGVDFVYMSLPGFMSECFADAGKRKRPTVVNEQSLVPDSVRWWKIANNITDKFGVGDAAKGVFISKNIQTVFASTMKGVTANVELKFTARCSTTDTAKLTATNPQRVTVDLVRAYIVATDQDIELPTRVAKVVDTVKPGATKSDFATDAVMKRLKDLGL